jgi:hypothetical protein
MKIIHFFWIGGALLLIGFIVPQNLEMPVSGATKNDYNQQSYWAYP